MNTVTSPWLNRCWHLTLLQVSKASFITGMQNAIMNFIFKTLPDVVLYNTIFFIKIL